MSILRGFGITVVVLAVAGGVKIGFCGSFCDSWSGQPDFRVYGLCLSPYKDGNRPPDYVPVEQIRERLEIVAPYTEWVRSFSATSGLEEIPEEANELGLKVAMGAWIRHEEVRDEEIDNLIEKAEAGYIDVAVVGNEELWWREAGKADAIEPSVLVEALETVRQRLNDANLSHIPVTTADPWDALFKREGVSFKYQEVLDAVDVFYVNIYPFHEHAHISKAIEKLEERYSSVLADANEAGPGKEVIIAETGWTSQHEHWGPAEPSLANAARYFYETQSWAVCNGVKMFWFAPFDEKWKAEPTPDEDPPDYEAHWGIWDNNGVIKESFLPEHVFCEDFDPCVNTFCAYTKETGATEPNILAPDGNSNGQFLRLLYDGNEGRLNSATFDQTAEIPFSRIVAEFDFRVFGDGYNGDGFSFLLLPTSRNGASGCHKYSYSEMYPEEPTLANTFAVGFEVCKKWPCSGGDSANNIYVSWDTQWYPDGGPIQVETNDVDLDSGKFHRVRIDLISCGDEDTALVTVMITPDVYDANHRAAVTVAENVLIGDASHPYKPYQNRIEFAGRNGDACNENVDIDNIYVSYTTEFCGYFLEGDVNGDCRINFFDLASLANNWLVNCNSSPVNEECMPD